MSRDRVRIFEVGPRDGLQNEPRRLGLEKKVRFIHQLMDAGLRDIELGAFVKSERVPQMADTDQLVAQVRSRFLKTRMARAWCLVPNRRALHRALEVGVSQIALFTAATESFTQNNIGMSIRESLGEFRAVIEEGRRVLGKSFQVRGYVSTVFGCPFEGSVQPAQALRVIEKMRALGVDQLSVGDTIGVATPRQVDRVIPSALASWGVDRMAVHFHDTRGTALANVLRALEHGVRIVDSSAGGLGGCPFAPGAAGNLATEDLVYMLEGMGLVTGVDLNRLCEASLEMARALRRPLTSRYLQSYYTKK
ncbi:MAG: hydroxymethylglutaryl-CoA lyase [Bdellovibrionia bacterium]